MRLIQTSRGHRRAASLIEFAMVVPVFMLLLLGILEYARFLFTVQLVNNAAREGARYAAVNTTAVSSSEIKTYVDRYLAGQGASQFVGYDKDSNITVYRTDSSDGSSAGDWQDAAWGDGIGVTVAGSYRPMLPGLMQLSKTLNVRGTSIMSCEAN